MSNNPKVYYFADAANPIPHAVAAMWQKHDFTLSPWTWPTEPVVKGSVLLLFTPYWNGNDFLSIEKVWKRFISKEPFCQPIKLIILGTAEASAPNYCDLLNLPDDPSALFANALPATAAWEPVSSGGMDMQEKLMRFLDGHSYSNRDQSVKEVFIRMRKSQLTYKDGISDKIEPIEYFRRRIFQEDTIVQFQTFLARWERYFPLFDALPFFTIFVAIEKEIKMLEALFKYPPTDEALTNWIEQAVYYADAIKTALDKIDNYVRD